MYQSILSEQELNKMENRILSHQIKRSLEDILADNYLLI